MEHKCHKYLYHIIFSIFNGHLLHGCSINKTGKHRRAFHCYFVSRNQPQQTDQRKFIREDTEKRLPPLAKYSA